MGNEQDLRSDLEWVMDQIHLEGLADMVNVGAEFDIFSKDNSYAQKVREAPQFLRFFACKLQTLANDPSRRDDIEYDIRRSLPQSGHPVGYYMARHISDTLGRKRLLECTDNPMKFFEAFCQTETSDERIFSESSLQTLRSLYWDE